VAVIIATNPSMISSPIRVFADMKCLPKPPILGVNDASLYTWAPRFPSDSDRCNHCGLYSFTSRQCCRLYRMLTSYRASLRISLCLPKSHQIRINPVHSYRDVVNGCLSLFHTRCKSLPDLVFSKFRSEGLIDSCTLGFLTLASPDLHRPLGEL